MVLRIVNLFISLIFFIYYIFLQKYTITKFCKKSKTNFYLVYWIDYIIVILSLFILSILCNISLLYFNKGNNNNDEEYIYIVLFNEYFPLFFSSNFITDIILSFQLMIKIKKIKISNKKLHDDIVKLKKKFKKLDILSHYKIKWHLFILLISYLIQGLIIFVIQYFKHYLQNKYIYINLYQIVLFILTTIIILILSNRNKSLIGYQIFFINNVMEKIYNNNRVKLVASSEHLLYKYICDLLLNMPFIISIFYNSKSDYLYKISYFYSIMLIGFLYLFFFGEMLLSVDSCNFTLLPRILKMLFCTKQFNFYFGDGKKIITKLFEQDDTDIYNYNIYFNKSKVFNSQEDFINKLNGINGYSETTISSILEKNNTINDADDDINNIINENSIFSESLSQDKIDEKIEEIEKQKMRKETEYGPCNFFIIFKLIYLYYNSNIKIYQRIKQVAEENCILNDINSQKNKNKSSPQRNNRRHSMNYQISNGQRISVVNIKEKLNTLTKIEKENLYSYKVFNINEVMGSIQEYGMKTFFIKYLSKNLEKNNEIKNNKQKTDNNNNNLKIKKNEIELDNKYLLPPQEIKDTIIPNNDFSNNITDLNNSNLNTNELPLLANSFIIDDNSSFYEFKIESLMNNILLDLFPFYEIDIKDILNSLETFNNMHLFETFFRKKNDDKAFNSYYTFDSFLSFEIYDNNTFLTYSQIKTFIDNYKQYFLDKISNFSYTFLPLIIGIFNITYLSYNKIVILYRNPLAFTPNAFYHYWLKFIFYGETEKMEKSTNTNDVIDINEKEVLNNIKLNKEEYLYNINILDDDLKFLINMTINLDFKLNLFILNNANNRNNGYDDSISNFELSYKNNITENTNLLNIIRNTEYFPGNNAFDPYNFKKKFFGSESICILEHLFMNDLVNNNNYTFKIYFSEIFKQKKINDQNQITNNLKLINDSNKISNSNITNPYILNEIKRNNLKFCENLKNKILKKIGKSEELFEEEL